MIAQEIKYADTLVENEINSLSKTIIKTLLYFNIFQYPLTKEEIQKYSSATASINEISEQLELLEGVGHVARKDTFYYLNDENRSELVNRRIEGNKKANKLLKVANRFSRFISFFPFVRGICLSGSLSKGYADKESDIDYFIITEPGRLWLCRTMLVMFKKLFLFNSHKYFCVNYFVDTSNLEIPDKNTFTATELISIIPTYNSGIYDQLMGTNKWTSNYFPNSLHKSSTQSNNENKSFIKMAMEWMFSGKIGDKIDDKCFRFTLRQWKKKFSDFDESQFDLRLRSRKNVSKHHPNGFQEKVMKSYEANIKEFENKFNISLQ
jgi:hypothetical protein